MNFGAARAKSKKRKLQQQQQQATTAGPSTPLAAPPLLKQKKSTKSVSSLRWKNIVLPAELGFDEDGGLLELDEVEGVDVVYGDGRVTFQVKDDSDEPQPKESVEPKRKKQKRSQAAIIDSPFPEEDPSEFQSEEVDDFPAGWTPVDDDFGVEELNNHVVQAEPKSRKDKVVAAEVNGGDAGSGVKAKTKKAAKGKGKAVEAIIAEAEYIPAEEFDVATSLPLWSHLPLPRPLFRSLAELNFTKPTAIQNRALSVEIGATPFVEPPPPAMRAVEDDEDDGEWGGIGEEDEGISELVEFKSSFPEEALPSTAPNTLERDVVGVAQTGSGKTLAYGLPILSYILSQHQHASSSSTDKSTRLSALILAPTRELALQVRSAISEVAIRTLPPLPPHLQDPNPNAPRKREKGHWISVVALTGGMSVDKQKRQLERGLDILVATPGRLWDLIGEDDGLARQIKGIKFLVIDEADRMIENGHFAELDNIVRLTRRKAEKEEEDFVDEFTTASSKHSNVDSIAPKEDMRTFVFSATMSKDLQRNLKKKHRGYKPGRPEDGMSSLDDLLLKLDFRDPDPELIDLSPESGIVDTLKECKIECMMPEKDVHLYHFLLRYPGRTIVFLSSIDGIRRLHPLLTLLGLNAIQLHSGMQQRARLKSLDRFKAATDAVLLATDVAARGLDIPSVSHVVHYQLPRSADVYVHRSGRTARAGQEGLALQLCAPDEKQHQKMLMASLGKDVDLPVLPTDFHLLDKLKERIELAKKIDSAMHKATKEAHDDNWLKQAAEAMDIEIDSDMEFSDGEENGRKSRKQMKSKQNQVKALKAELQALLDKPLMMRGLSAKYLTTRGRVGFVDQLVAGTNHSAFMGLETSTALADLPKPKKKPSDK